MRKLLKKQISFINELLSRDIPLIVISNELHMACLFFVDISSSMGYLTDNITSIDELNLVLNCFKDGVYQDEKTKNILDIAIVEFNDNVNVIQKFSQWNICNR